MVRAADIHSLSEFQRNAPQYVDQIEATHNPVAITVNGEAKVIVQDARVYERMAEDLERMRLQVALLEGEADIAAGRTQDADEFFADLEVEYGLSD